MWKSIILALLAALVVLVAGCGGEEGIAAKIENEKITVAELEEQLKRDYGGQAIGELTLDEKTSSLEKLLTKRRRYLRALELGLDKEPAYAAEYRVQRARAIAVDLYAEIINEAMFTDELLEQYYEWGDFRIATIHITIGHEGAYIFNKSRTKEEAFALAQSYADSMKIVEDQEEFAQRVTDDSRNRVRLKQYPFAKFGLKPDSAVVNGTPGDIVGPVECSRGYLVFKIVDKQEVPQTKTFEETKEQLGRQLQQGLQYERNLLFEEYSEDFKAKYNAQIDDAGCAELIAALAAWGKDPKHNMDSFSDEERNIKLASIQDITYTAQDFFTMYGSRLLRDFRKFQSAEALKKAFLEDQLNLLAWSFEGEERGVHTHDNVIKDVHKFAVNRLADLLEEDQVPDDYQPAEEDVFAYYEENKESYKVSEKIKVYQICVKDEATGKSIVRQAQNGTDFQELYKDHNIKHKGKNVRFKLGYQARKTRYTEVVDKAFEMGENKIDGPFLLNDGYFVIMTEDHKPASYRSFEQVQARITNQLKREWEEAEAGALDESLRDSYTHSIFESALREIS